MSNKSFTDYEKTIHEVLKLKDIPESQLLDPIQEGKWCVREIISHLFYWDKFNLDQMAPHMSNNANLPPFPDHDFHNQDAIKYIDRYKSVDSLIDEFSQTRKQLLDKMSSIENGAKFTIGTRERQFSVDSFITIFVDHDAHHLKQIRDKLSLKSSK